MPTRREGVLPQAWCMELLLLLVAILRTGAAEALSTRELIAEHCAIIGFCMGGDLGPVSPKQKLATCAIHSALTLLQDSPKRRCVHVRTHAVAGAKAVSV